MTRQQRIRQNERLRNRYEKAFYAPVKKALKNQLSSFTSDLQQYGKEQAIANMDLQLWNKELAPLINKVYVETGLAKANQTLSELRRLPKVSKKRTSFGYNQEWTQEILNYFSKHLFDKVVLPISDTTKEYIMNVISKGVDEGWSIEQMVKEIEREDYLDGRVRRILRTESNRAINYGNELAADKFEYKTQKRWIAVDDHRTRPAHHAADNQTVNQTDTFSVGGEQLQFPGDPNGSGANTINCRCFSEVVVMRDSNGRLMPKEGEAEPVRVRGRLRAELQSILAELTS
jgi:uncharacterized protein with gpF-like domain